MYIFPILLIYEWSNGPTRIRTSLGPSFDLRGSMKRTFFFLGPFQANVTFSKNKFSNPCKYYGEPLFLLWYFTKALETLLDLHRHSNGLLNGPCEADFIGPLVKEGLQGHFMVQFSKIDLKTMNKIDFSSPGIPKTWNSSATTQNKI